MVVIIASEKSNQKIYHKDMCYHAEQISDENKIFFYTEKEARDAGYRACNCCNRFAKRYRQEHRAIKDICSKHNIKVKFYDGAVYVDTCVDSWKVIITERKHSLVLLHANGEIYQLNPIVNGMVVHNYHLQKDFFATTIVSYLNYIWKHDEWIINGGRDSKYGGKKKAKSHAIHRVCNMIERLEYEAAYSELNR